MSTYDDLPYDSHPYDRTHPDHMAVIGRLFGMQPPNVDACRVLELGCAAGGNLIPQAIAAPDCQFLGVDLSKRQLETGWKSIEQLQLDNIELRHADIRDITEDDGKFDYIICHGVYSWVPQDVQRRILEICATQLTDNGLGYISYNTNPGWFLRGMIRQMMCYHARQFDNPEKQVQQARALLDFLINAGPAADPTYHALLSRELEILRNRADSYLYHEHLEEENEPLFFYEFNERCEEVGLRYVGETQLSEMVPGNFSSKAAETIQELGVGIIQAEQYLDFLRNRTFRRSLVCRKNVELDRTIDPEKLAGLHVGIRLRPKSSQLHLTDNREEDFIANDGRVVKVSHPLVKAALLTLHEQSPATVAYDDLATLADERRSGGPTIRNAAALAAESYDLATTIIELYANDLVDLRQRPARFTVCQSSHPFASPLARMQAETSSMVTNLRHELIKLTESQTHLIRLLDGAHDVPAIVLAFQQLIDDGTLVVDQRGKSADPKVAAEFLGSLIQHDLQGLIDRALLMR